MLPSNDQIALNRQEIEYTIVCGNQGEIVKGKKTYQRKTTSKWPPILLGLVTKRRKPDFVQ